MIRIHTAAAAAAVICSLINVGCDSDAKQPFKKTDGATNAGGSDSGSGSDSAAGGSSGSNGGSSGDGSVAPGACGSVFGHTGACKTCLEAHCCTEGKACANVADCPELAKCTEDCDAKGGTKTVMDQCITTCNNQFLTGDSRIVYNPLTICMGQSCLSECPFHGP